MPGDKFDAVLEAQLDAAKVVLVLIGPAWLQELKERSTKGGIDYHRAEVARALREGKRVIPVLLRDASLPPGDALPQDLLALSYCQTISMRDETWVTDVHRLIEATGRPYRWDLLAVRIVIAVSLGVFAVVVVSQIRGDLGAHGN